MQLSLPSAKSAITGLGFALVVMTLTRALDTKSWVDKKVKRQKPAPQHEPDAPVWQPPVIDRTFDTNYFGLTNADAMLCVFAYLLKKREGRSVTTEEVLGQIGKRLEFVPAASCLVAHHCYGEHHLTELIACGWLDVAAGPGRFTLSVMGQRRVEAILSEHFGPFLQAAVSA